MDEKIADFLFHSSVQSFSSEAGRRYYTATDKSHELIKAL